MANRIPVKAVFTGADVTALGEFESGDTIDGAYISGSVGGSLSLTGGAMTGAITTNSTFDSRDVANDGAKLDNIEASADVTDTANVVAALTAGTNVAIANNGTISATDTNTQYSVGDGGLTQNNFTNALKTKLDNVEAIADVTDTANVVAALTAGTNVQIANNGTISATDTNTTYSVTDGQLSENNFTNAQKTKLDGIEAGADHVDTANVVATLTAGSNVAIAANGTISATDTNTTYSVGNGGLTQNNFTDVLKAKLDGVETSANVTDTANVVAALTAGSNVTIAANGTIASSFTNTTYSVGDNGLTKNNFTDALKTKLDGVEAGADHVDAANVEAAGAVMVANRTIQAESSGTPSGGTSGDIVYQY